MVDHVLEIDEGADAVDASKPVLIEERIPFTVKVDTLGPINGVLYHKGDTVMLTATRGKRHQEAGDVE